MNYLAVEQPTLERLRDAVSSVPPRNIMKAADLAGVTVKSQVTPALYLIYAGDQVQPGDDGRSTYGDAQVVTQNWIVVVAVKHARGGEEAHAEAGEIISEVISALSGWAPLDGYTTFVRTTAPRPGYIKNFAYFPLQFSINQLTE